MEHYDLRVIADCLVFSYEVEGPKKPERVPAPKKECPVRDTRGGRNRHLSAKRLFLRMLLFVLAPFALFLDALIETGRIVLRSIGHGRGRRARFASALGGFSCLTLIGAILHLW